jgi:hypothetical protein
MLERCSSHRWHDSRQFAQRCGTQQLRSDYYKFARGGLCLTCDDVQFADRFRILFAECASSAAELEGLEVFWLELTTNLRSNTSLISFSSDESVDYCTFILKLFPERSLRLMPENKSAGLRYLADSGGREPVIAVGRNQLVVDRNYAWQAIAAQFAVSNAMRLQHDVRFFHAATVGIGSNGVFIAGAKGSGKTTVSLALAARSHAFLGDEYAAVCATTGTLLPFRRAVSIRPGSRAAKLEARLQGMNPLTDRSEDGLTRVRLSVRDVFPDAAPRSVGLSHCFFLRGFERKPRAVEVAPCETTLPSLQPLLASLWSQRPGMLMLELLRVFSRARCFDVHVGGTPDETAELIESVVEGK